MAKKKEMNSTGFRAELQKIMPGYKWTVHKSYNPTGYLSATGIQSSGFNRLSTLLVNRRVEGGEAEYTVMSAGFGGNAPWLSEHSDGTLARALRGLQDYYEAMASTYRVHAIDLQNGRQ